MFKATWVQALLVAIGGSFGLACGIAAPFAILVDRTDIVATFQAALEVSVGLFVMELPIMVIILQQYKQQQESRRGGGN